MPVADSSVSKPFDPFELAVALLLGVGAIATAIAGHQSGLWGGASVEGYGEAAAMTTAASSTYNDELTTYMQDAMVDNRAKELIWEGLEEEDEVRARRLKAMASWLYSEQLSDPALTTLQLPGRDDAAATGSDEAAAEGDAEEDVFMYSDEVLETALNNDLDEDYVDTVFTPSSKEFTAAKARFDQARGANEMGDRFSLASVILTISLFFGGLALVFKTRMRWGFLASGAIIATAGIGYMVTLTWA
jgi:hypothetical protein